ncbi:hypothetical protein JCM3775_002138 [Rhodotorula graminis]
MEQPSYSTPPRARPDAHIVPVSPSPSPSTPTHRSTLSTRSTQQPARVREVPRSRTTSVDYGRSNPFSDFDSPAHDDPHSVPLLPTSTSSRFVRLNLDKDVPDLPDDEQRLLPDSPSSPSTSSSAPSRRRPRRGEAVTAAGRASDRTRRCARWFLVVVAGAAGVVVLVALLTTEDARASARGKVDEAVQAVGGWVGVGTVAAGSGTSAGGLEASEERYDKGADGDEVTLEGGEKVVYRNAFGGTFDGDPHSLSARAQDDSPTLSEPWDYERLRIRGVNLGGWLTLEPFITPHLFEPFLDAPTPAEDEYTLSQNLRDQGRLMSTLREHYDTFITEKDFIAIAAAGLNWVRIPVPYWAVETWVDEPYLEKVAWNYLLKSIGWARKYGIRINLDLHSVPGSQNGWNHSGRLGSISFLRSSMGQANAQRALDYIAALAEFTSRKGVREVVPMYSVLNEPMLAEIGDRVLRGFYRKAYETARNITGYGPQQGPFLAFHDGFKGTHRWYNFLESPSPHRPHVPATDGLDRVAYDSHRYLAFTEPDLRSVRQQVLKPCAKWSHEFNKTMINAGVAISGEFSLGVNDCGRFLNNIFQGTRLEGTFPNETSPAYPPTAPRGSCEFWEDYEQWDEEMRSALRDLALAQMDTFQNWFYWTWRTLPSTTHLPHLPANALWSYSLGLAQGWIPADPRAASDDGGFCVAYAAKIGVDPDAGGGRRYLLDDVELGAWKVGRPGSTYSGRVPQGAAESHRALYPAAEFDTPSRGWNAGGLPVAGLWAYAREGDAPVLESPAGAEGPTARATERRWASKKAGCRYPSSWGAPAEPEQVGLVPPECSVQHAVERGEL